MSKYDRIVRDPEICGGAPVIKGTRVLVMDILDWIKEGKTFQEILENFPTISREDIREIISYAQDIISGETVIYGSKDHQVFCDDGEKI